MKYVARAVEACRLPIKVRYAAYSSLPQQAHMIVQRMDDGSYGLGHDPINMAQATAAYVALRAKLLAAYLPDGSQRGALTDMEI